MAPAVLSVWKCAMLLEIESGEKWLGLKILNVLWDDPSYQKIGMGPERQK